MPAFGKGFGKGAGAGKGPDNAHKSGQTIPCDCSKGKGKADVVDAFWKGKGKKWVLEYKYALDAKLAYDHWFTSIPKGGPPMQKIFAYDIAGDPKLGTDTFWSHQYVKPEDSTDGKLIEWYQYWWTPKPKSEWHATKPKQWVYMGVCSWTEEHHFKPQIWGKAGCAVRMMRSV